MSMLMHQVITKQVVDRDAEVIAFAIRVCFA
jgi:hypothetical protein